MDSALQEVLSSGGALFSSLHHMLKSITDALPAQVSVRNSGVSYFLDGVSRFCSYPWRHPRGRGRCLEKGAVLRGLPINTTPQLLGSFTAALLVQETVLNLGASASSHGVRLG